MKDKDKNISLAIMGGTFDPIHYGHLVAAEAVRTEFNLEKVIFIPSAHPPHKKGLTITGPEKRLAMTRLAVASNPYFEVSDVEMKREGPSFTVDTLKFFRQIYGSNAKIYFITGADAILEIITWKKVEDLMELCRFIAVTRPGFSLEELSRLLPPEFLSNIHILQAPGLAISSTDLRKKVREGRSIKYLVPEPVEEFIYQHSLYKC